MRYPRCVVDEKFFLTEGPVQAYWAGFLLADGCISQPQRAQGRPQTFLTAASKDLAHLEQLKAALASTYKISGPYAGCWHLSVPSAALCQSLRRWNVVPRKSLIASPPALPESLESHWARGVMDGDGCLSTAYRGCKAVKRNGKGRPPRPGRVYPVASIAGTESVCGWFQHRFGGPVRPHARIFTWTLTGQDVPRFLDWLYRGSREATRLTRKFHRSLELRSPEGVCLAAF